MSKSTKNMYCPPDYVDQEASQELFPGNWRNETTNIQGLIDLKAQGFNNSTRAEANNTYISTYVLSPTTLDNLFHLW